MEVQSRRVQRYMELQNALERIELICKREELSRARQIQYSECGNVYDTWKLSKYRRLKSGIHEA